MSDRDPAVESRHPRRIGVYRLDGFLGQGGMGEVLLAFDTRLQRYVAIKRLRRKRAWSARKWKRFLREARAVAQLNHPAIVQVYDLIHDGEGDCIVMEYVPGPTVALLRQAVGPLSPQLAVSLARQVAGGLAEAHAQGVIHRDLKAENVIVRPSGRAKICDFGLAKRKDLDESTVTARGVVVGTYRSVSPEQIRGGDLDPRSDLFSLGVLLYEMLAGSSPFLSNSPVETLRRICEERPPSLLTSLPELPPALSDLVDQLLEKQRRSRPADARSVVKVLESIAETLEPYQRWPPFPADFKVVPFLRETAACEESTSDHGALTTQAGSLGDVEEAEETGMAEEAGTVGEAGTAEGIPRMETSNEVFNRWRPWRRAAFLGVVLLILSIVFFAINELRRDQLKPLRILVLEPQVFDLASPERVATAVQVATLDALTSFERMVPLDLSVLPPGMAERLSNRSLSPVEAAQAVAADEVLSLEVAQASGGTAQISLKRLGNDGSVLWSRNFVAPVVPEKLLLLADAVNVHLADAYPGFQSRRKTLQRQIRADDYNAFLRIMIQVSSGRASLSSGVLDEVEALVERAPQFLEVQLLGARVARYLHYDTREVRYLERARLFLDRVRVLAPEDPRPLFDLVPLNLTDGREAEAQEALDRLREISPGDPQSLALAAVLARHRGQSEEALTLLRAAVHRRPTWKSLFDLADLEYQSGFVDEGRRRFEQILELDPENLWVLGRLAALEMAFGDLDRAEMLFRQLVEGHPSRSYFNNLGLIYSLKADYDQAVEAYHQALEHDPGHLVVVLNLADAELARGRTPEARALYTDLLQRLDSEELSETQPVDWMMKAQCLARLGLHQQSSEVAARTLRSHPEHPEILFLAALIYSCANQPAESLAYVKAALDKGYHRRWFTLPAFDVLTSDPEFQRLLARGR